MDVWSKLEMWLLTGIATILMSDPPNRLRLTLFNNTMFIKITTAYVINLKTVCCVYPIAH